MIDEILQRLGGTSAGKMADEALSSVDWEGLHQRSQTAFAKVRDPMVALPAGSTAVRRGGDIAKGAVNKLLIEPGYELGGHLQNIAEGQGGFGDYLNAATGVAGAIPAGAAAKGAALILPMAARGLKATEKITGAAVRTSAGIFDGVTHATAAEKAAAKGVDISKLNLDDIDGFLTSTGRYVSREEAAKIADAFGQTSKPGAPRLESSVTNYNKGDHDVLTREQALALPPGQRPRFPDAPYYVVGRDGTKSAGQMAGYGSLADARNAAGLPIEAQPMKSAEHIDQAATMYDGKVYTGQLHSDSVGKLIEEMGMTEQQFEREHKKMVQGYVTNTGRFLERDEATKLTGGTKPIHGDATYMTKEKPLVREPEKGAGGGGGIRAYHASPHEFEKFDMSKVGTGLGHAYRGEGMNFTTSEAKALAMREQYFPGGHVYETNLRVSPEELLNFDKPIAEQPHVQKALDSAGVVPGGNLPAFARKNLTGKDALAALENLETPAWRKVLNDPMVSTSQQGARQHLLKSGIPGGVGADQHVIYDAALIDILRKYGIVGGVLGGGAMAATNNEAKAQ